VDTVLNILPSLLFFSQAIYISIQQKVKLFWMKVTIFLDY